MGACCGVKEAENQAIPQPRKTNTDSTRKDPYLYLKNPLTTLEKNNPNRNQKRKAQYK
jgi:hypothetical protein